MQTPPSKFFLEHIYKASSGYYATWYPNSPLKLGEIRRMDPFGVAQPYSTLEKMGLPAPETETSPNELDMDCSTGGTFTSSVKASGDAPVLGSLLSTAEAGINIQFNTGNSIVFTLKGCKSTQITNRYEIEQAVTKLSKNGGWDSDLMIITEVVEAASGTILISTTGGSSVDLKAKSALNAGQVKIGDADVELLLGKNGNAVDHYILQGASTPLYKASRLVKPLFGKPKLETRDFASGNSGVGGQFHLEEVGLPGQLNATNTPPAIYALLVGIDKYRDPENQLKGCVNDIKSVEEWLKETYTDRPLFIKRMSDEDTDSLPNRTNIIAAFDHFNQAGNKDTCLFYYCGHGTNLANPPLFAGDEGTGVIQALVCLDTEEGNRYITDKELSYLIWKTCRNRPAMNFTVITDCCHSGSMTRDYDAEHEQLASPLKTDIGFAERMLKTADNAPAIETFAGFTDEPWEGMPAYEAISVKEDGKPVYKVQMASHFHFGAAMDNQTAAELTVNGQKRGALTYVLLDYLKQNKRTAYSQLQTQVRAGVKNIFTLDGRVVHEQVPLLNVYSKPAGWDLLFLDNQTIYSKTGFDVYYDKTVNSWRLAAGLLHGINPGNTVAITTEKGINSLPLKHIGLVSCILDGTLPAPVAGSAQLRAEVTGETENRLCLAFDESVEEYRRLLFGEILNRLRLSSATGQYGEWVFADGAQQANFIVHADRENYCITGTDPAGTKSAPFELADDAVSETVLKEKLLKIANWNRVLKLENKDGFAADAAFKINMQISSYNEANGSTEFIAGSTGLKVANDMKYANGTNPTFKLKIDNTGSKLLYCTFAYLGADFAISTNVFNSAKWLEIDTGKSTFLSYKDKEAIPVSNRSEAPIINCVKVFVTVDAPADLTVLNQQESKERDLGKDDESGDLLMDQSWQTETVLLNIYPKAK